MFYFHGITSYLNMLEHKRKVDEKLNELYQDLEDMLYWDKIHNEEMYLDYVSDYQYLKNFINKVLNKKEDKDGNS